MADKFKDPIDKNNWDWVEFSEGNFEAVSQFVGYRNDLRRMRIEEREDRTL